MAQLQNLYNNCHTFTKKMSQVEYVVRVKYASGNMHIQ